MDIILAMPSEEDRKEQYEVIVVETAKDMLKKLSSKRPNRVLIDSGMISKLSKADLQTVTRACPVTVLPQQEHNRIVQDLRARIIKTAIKAFSGGRIGKARGPVKFSRSVIVNQKAAGHAQPALVPRIILPELHDPINGRIDSKKVADHLAIPLSRLSEPLGVDYGSIHKTPSAERLQPALRHIKRDLEILSQMIGNHETVLAWLNTPHPFLDKKTPLQMILEGHAEQLETILENAVEGIPY